MSLIESVRRNLVSDLRSCSTATPAPLALHHGGMHYLGLEEGVASVPADDLVVGRLL